MTFALPIGASQGLDRLFDGVEERVEPVRIPLPRVTGYGEKAEAVRWKGAYRRGPVKSIPDRIDGREFTLPDIAAMPPAWGQLAAPGIQLLAQIPMAMRGSPGGFRVAFRPFVQIRENTNP